MDYANRVRLKVWAQMTVIDAADDPALIERLHMPNYPARIERAMLLKVEAFDWNCQQHITPRFTEEEIAPLVAQFTTRIQELEAEMAALKS
jgi:predicted pyridoxine 5'-phosphate oxidase superfamily flavin-nucleotide-binding protein